MPVTQSDIDKLNAAIASGERQVTIGDTSVTYNTTDSLIKARDDMRAELRAQERAALGRRTNKHVRLYHAGRGD